MMFEKKFDVFKALIQSNEKIKGVHLNSKYQFLDLFINKINGLNILETVIFEEGKIKNWFSIKEGNLIKKKDEFLNNQQIYENFKDKTNIIRLSNEEIFEINSKELRIILDGRIVKTI